MRGEQYYQWMERREKTSAAPGEALTAVQDSKAAKLCPECSRLLIRYRVGHGADFSLDRCNTCAGIWFDAAEFETLHQLGLHDRIHFIFSAAWQANVTRDDQRKSHDALLLQKLGTDDFEELKRVRAWVRGHAHRAAILASLTESE